MKKIILLLFFFPVVVYSADIMSVIDGLADNLAEKYSETASPFYSRRTVTIVGIQNLTPDAAENYVGEAVAELLKNAIADSLIFKLVDRKNIGAAMEEIRLSLSGLTEGSDAPEPGKISGVKLLLDGSVTGKGNSFVINLRLVNVETMEVVAYASASIPKEEMIAESERISYEYITANGIGVSLYVSPSRFTIFNQSEPVEVADGNTYVSSLEGSFSYRLSSKWKFSIDIDSNSKDVFYDYRSIGSMENLTAWDDVFASDGPEILGFWERDGSFTAESDKTVIEAELASRMNYYTLNQRGSSVSFMLSRVFQFSRRLSVSAGLGPHVNWLRYTQIYDNVPILINEGIAFKRYEIIMDFIGAGGTASLNIEYFILPRLAVNLGISGFYSYIFSKSDSNLNAWSPSTGEYYYEIDNYAIESFGLNPFMMPDGRYITNTLYSVNYVKFQIGASIYF